MDKKSMARFSRMLAGKPMNKRVFKLTANKEGGVVKEASVTKKADYNYRASALSDAKDFIATFKDEIVEKLVDDGEASDDWNNDYNNGDFYFHGSYVDKDYKLKEATELLDQLSDVEETDSGLWEGQDPHKALATQAAFTYGNAVGEELRGLIKKINVEFSNLDLESLPDVEEGGAKKAAEEIVAKAIA